MVTNSITKLVAKIIIKFMEMNKRVLSSTNVYKKISVYGILNSKAYQNYTKWRHDELKNLKTIRILSLYNGFS